MALDIFAEFATDESLENNGAWHKLGKGTELLIARAGNKAYGDLLSKQMEQYQGVLEANDDAAAEQWTDILVHCLSRTVLLGWKNLDYQKKPYGEYSVEKAEKLLRHKDFRQRVQKLSEGIDAYRAKMEVAQGEA
jgi:hypothetical protein